jgi:hypothetical protein
MAHLACLERLYFAQSLVWKVYRQVELTQPPLTIGRASDVKQQAWPVPGLEVDIPAEQQAWPVPGLEVDIPVEQQAWPVPGLEVDIPVEQQAWPVPGLEVDIPAEQQAWPVPAAEAGEEPWRMIEKLSENQNGR